MKKAIFIFMMVGIILVSSACSKNEKDNENPIKNTQENTFSNLVEELDLETFKVECEELKDAVDINLNATMFVTKNGEIYDLDVNKLYSDNDKNCKKIDTSIKAKKFVFYHYIIDVNNNIYNYSSFDKITEIDEDIEISMTRLDYNNRYVYYYYKDKKIYLMQKNNDTFILTDDVLFSLKDDEDLEYILESVIKTTKRIYTLTEYIKNEEQCNKYNDVKCEYGYTFLEVKENVRNNIDSILLYKDGVIVDKNGVVYAKCAGCGG